MKQITISSQLKKLSLILSDNQYHSGTDIGESLGLTRSGVWKLIKQLTTLGISIDSVTNKGYRTENILEFLEKTKIKKYVSEKNLTLLNDFFVFDTIASTNDYLVAHAKQANHSNAICFSEHQTAGRGRLGRSWASPFLSNIYMSLLWRFNFDITALAGLNILAGVSVINSLQKLTKIDDLQLKWPNDIMWNHYKLGGILIDVIGEYNGLCSVVIGIGLNINMTQNPIYKIDKPWTAINRVTNTPISRNHIAGVILDELISNLLLFTKNGLTDFIKKWKKYDYLTGNFIKISTPSKDFAGIAKGIDDYGRLILEIKNNSKIIINSGDASLVT